MRPVLMVMLSFLVVVGLGVSQRLGAETSTPKQGEELLQAVMAAQQQLLHVHGQFRQSTVQSDDPDAKPNVYDVRFAFSLPHKYHLRFQPQADPEEKEWFVSDGEQQWHAEQLFADDPPIVDKKPVDKNAWGFHRVVEFFHMDMTGLREDFTVTAQVLEVPPIPAAAVAINLVPRANDLAEEIRSIQVLVGKDYLTQGVIITDGHDNRITIEVVQADYQTAPDPKLFTWAE